MDDGFDKDLYIQRERERVTVAVPLPGQCCFKILGTSRSEEFLKCDQTRVQQTFDRPIRQELICLGDLPSECLG